MVHPAFELRRVDEMNAPQILGGQVHQRPNSRPWHPKISPYRFIVLTTTIGLGTAKAVLTQRGSTLAPITLEWIAGTILFLLFFSFGTYDSGEDVPLGLCWLFKPDCMNLVWRLLKFFSIPRPSYTSEERTTIPNTHGSHPPITLYRILICCTVVSFGMSKAVLGYYGFSATVTWMDWALSVPITTFLYLVGLYEYNTSNAWSYFFIADQSELLYSLNIGIKHTIGVLLALGWTLGSAHALRHITYDPDWDFKTIRPENYTITIRTRVDDGYDFALKSSLQESLLVAIVAGIAALCNISAYIVRDVTARGGVVRAALRVLRRPIVRLVEAIIPLTHEEWLLMCRPSYGYNWEEFITSMVTALRVLVHVGLHLFGIIFSLTFGMLSLGFTATMVDLVQNNKDGIVLRMGFVFLPAFWGFATVGCIFNAVRILFSMLAPFLYYICESTPFSESSLLV